MFKFLFQIIIPVLFFGSVNATDLKKIDDADLNQVAPVISPELGGYFSKLPNGPFGLILDYVYEGPEEPLSKGKQDPFYALMLTNRFMMERCFAYLEVKKLRDAFDHNFQEDLTFCEQLYLCTGKSQSIRSKERCCKITKYTFHIPLILGITFFNNYSVYGKWESYIGEIWGGPVTILSIVNLLHLKIYLGLRSKGLIPSLFPSSNPLIKPKEIDLIECEQTLFQLQLLQKRIKKAPIK